MGLVRLKMDKWISVEDRLPTVMVDVLLVHVSEMGGASAIFGGYRTTDYWFETHYYCPSPKNAPHEIPADQITHWMPLPEPPSG